VERISLPFAQNLKRLGVDASVRTVDDTQYQQRIQDLRFRHGRRRIGESLSPGNEQRYYWASAAADHAGQPEHNRHQGSGIDILSIRLSPRRIAPNSSPALRALDRVLLWNYFVIPHFHLSAARIAY